MKSIVIKSLTEGRRKLLTSNIIEKPVETTKQLLFELGSFFNFSIRDDVLKN